MKKIELKEEQVRAAFRSAESDEVKGMLKALFPEIAKEMEKKKPTLDDYTSIKSYEDACHVLGEPYMFSEDYVMDMIGIEGGVHFHIYGRENTNIENIAPVCGLPKHIIALMKLETISRALWGRNWEPSPDASGDKCFWYPWFALWTEKEIQDLNEDQRGALLSGAADTGASAGFGYLLANTRSSLATAYVGFRLCQETEEKARYFGTQFVELWAEYLAFNFTTGERIK